ncbi:MAG: hypothetical protein HYY84_02825 [Deltaproteobacteria bacterium]|nr:hypothetical protein [Deltaproteobacteria bacterium]
MTAVLLSIAFPPAPANATVIYARTLKEMAKRADAIVVGAVTTRASQYGRDEHGTRIYTFTRIAIERTLKGKQLTDVVIRQWGGTVGGVTMKVPGNAEFTVGERVVLFLRAGRGGVFHLPNLAASKFSIRFEGQKTFLVRNLEGIAFASRSPEKGFRLLDDRLPSSKLTWQEFYKEIAEEVTK